LIARVVAISLLIGLARPCIARAQDSSTTLCVTAGDTKGWLHDTVGPFLVELPQSLNRDTSGQAELSYYHGGGRWADRQLVVEWGISHRAYAGALFDSGEQHLMRSLPDPPSVNGCKPKLTDAWLVHVSVDGARHTRRLRIWMLPPTPRESIYSFEFTAHSPDAWQRAVTIAQTIRLSGLKP